MTREDAKKKLWSNRSINSLSKVECNDILDKAFDYFEAKIAELESPKSCDGCKHCIQARYCSKLNIEFSEFPIQKKSFYCNQYEPKDS